MHDGLPSLPAAVESLGARRCGRHVQVNADAGRWTEANGPRSVPTRLSPRSVHRLHGAWIRGQVHSLTPGYRNTYGAQQRQAPTALLQSEGVATRWSDRAAPNLRFRRGASRHKPSNLRPGRLRRKASRCVAAARWEDRDAITGRCCTQVNSLLETAAQLGNRLGHGVALPSRSVVPSEAGGPPGAFLRRSVAIRRSG